MNALWLCSFDFVLNVLRSVGRVLLLTVLLGACASATRSPSTTAWTSRPGTAISGAAVRHIFIIMMENKSASTILKNPNVPYINRLIGEYGYAASYYGVTHPSLPNYVATIAGDYFGAQSDDESLRFSGASIVDQLEAHHRSWKAYMESLPSAGYNGNAFPPGALPLYRRKHDPFMLMTSVVQSSARRTHVVPASQLHVDLASNRVPDFAYIVPNICHDMHGFSRATGSCTTGTDALMRTGDAYLATLIPAIMRSRAWTGGSVIFVIWDESDDSSGAGCCDAPLSNGGGRVPAIVIARNGVRHYVSRSLYNHYALLATIQAVWGLGCLRKTCDRTHVRPMTEFLQRPG